MRLLVALSVGIVNLLFLFFLLAGWITYQKYELTDVKSRLLSVETGDGIWTLLSSMIFGMDLLFGVEALFCVLYFVFILYLGLKSASTEEEHNSK